MKTFEVQITKSVRTFATVRVEASCPTAAEVEARKMAESDNVDWEDPDDTPGSTSFDIGDIEEVV